MEVKDLSTLNDDLAIIQKLEDEPNDMGGMSATELKEAFDRSGLIIQQYINQVLIPELKSESGAANLGMIDPDGQDKSNVQAVVAKLAKSLKDVVIAAGALPLGGTPGQLLRKASDGNYDTEWGGVLESQLPSHLAKANQLSAETAALFGLGENAVPDTVFSILSAGAKVETGNYVGTGTYGEANPNQLTIGENAKMVFVMGASAEGMSSYAASSHWILDGAFMQVERPSGNTSGNNFCKATYQDGVLSWYDESFARDQLNSTDMTYAYIVVSYG